MRDIEKELFLNNFDIDDYDKKLVNSIEDFEAKIKGEVPINEKDLRKIIEGTEEVRFVDTSEINDMFNLFHCSRYEELDLSRWETSNVKDMSQMFHSCKSLTKLDTSNFDTSKVEYMDYMFEFCHSLKELVLSNFNTSKVKNMTHMFSFCDSLKSLDLSNFDTSKVKEMSGMFYNCESLKELDLLNFDNSNLIDVDNMFYFCKSLKELDLSTFKTHNVKNINDMFCGCEDLVVCFGNENIDLELIEKMNIPCFKYDLEDSNLEKTHTLDSDLLELTFLDNDVGMVFIKHLKEKGELNVCKMNDNFHLVKSNSEGYSVNKEQMEKLEESGVLMEIEKPKVKNRRKNKM